MPRTYSNTPVRASVEARYACSRCARSRLTCRIPPGYRSCVACTRVRRRCVTTRSVHPSTTALRSRIASIRLQLTSMLSNLSSLDNFYDEPVSPDSAAGHSPFLGSFSFPI